MKTLKNTNILIKTIEIKKYIKNIKRCLCTKKKLKKTILNLDVDIDKNIDNTNNKENSKIDIYIFSKKNNKI